MSHVMMLSLDSQSFLRAIINGMNCDLLIWRIKKMPQPGFLQEVSYYELDDRNRAFEQQQKRKLNGLTFQCKQADRLAIRNGQ